MLNLYLIKNFIHNSKNKIYIFSNIKNKLIAHKDSKVIIKIYDEIVGKKNTNGLIINVRK